MQDQSIERGICSYGKRARIALSGNWLYSTGIVFLVGVIPAVCDIIVDQEIQIFGLLSPLLFTLGLNQFFLNIRKGRTLQIKNIFFTFQSVRLFIQSIFLVLLLYAGTLIGLILFIVPGIIFLLGTSQATFIFIQNPQINCIQAIKRSWRMMKGKKRQLFALYLISVLWFILGLLCLVFGSFFAISYVMTMFADFYMIHKPQEEEQIVSDQLAQETSSVP